MTSRFDSCGLSVAVVPELDVTPQCDTMAVLVSVQTPEGAQRLPVDIVCVIDISWSMSMEAVIQTGDTIESNDLSMLCLAKHAVATVIKTLGPQDRFALVKFCAAAEMVLPLTYMNEQGQDAAMQKVEGLGFGSGTYLWGGINHALQCLQGDSEKGRIAHIMLLTDGETEKEPDVMSGLSEFKDNSGKLPCTINAFGFGYETCGRLLLQIAEFSAGSYAFIPDAGFVGTIFVNSLSNLLCTVAANARLTLSGENGAEIVSVMGGWHQVRGDTRDSFVLELGALQYGQNRDVVLQMKNLMGSDSYLSVSLEFESGEQIGKCETEGSVREGQTIIVSRHLNRCRFVSELLTITETLQKSCDEAAVKTAHEKLKVFTGEIASSPSADTAEVKALLDDCIGQCSVALEQHKYWMKWGRHYVPSVAMAHKLQQCNNFKDPGVQVYGGDMFKELQDTADNAFNELPAPKATEAEFRYHGGGKITQNPKHPKWAAMFAPAAAVRGSLATPAAPAPVAAGRGSPATPAAAPPRPAPVNMAIYNNCNSG